MLGYCAPPAQGVDIDAWISRDDWCGRLVDICLALQVQTTAAYVPHTKDRLPEHFALDSEITLDLLEGGFE